MKFVFVDQQPSKPYTVSTPRKEALGGSQSAICYYAGALAKLGHEVILVNQITSPTLDDGVQVMPTQWYFDQRGYVCDIIILCSAVFPTYFDVVEQNFRYKLSICWQGHFGTEPPLALSKSYLFHVDLFAFVSEYQRNHFCRHFNLPIEKTVLMLNGISPFFHDVDITQKTDTCIYFSNPGRGLHALPDIWPRIQKEHPNAKLEIFSSNKTYGGEDSQRTTEVKNQLRAMRNVSVFESAGQDVLAKHCAKSAFLLYPTHFVETSCIVCLESSAAGALPLVTDMGVFPEYVPDCIHYGPDFEPHFAKKACEAFDTYYKKTPAFLAKSRDLSTTIRAKHNYATLAKELIENCRKFSAIKGRSITRQKETVDHDMGRIYAGESTPLFFETKMDAANYFLQHGNKLFSSDYYRSAEQHYLRSWDIIQSPAAGSNLIVYYSKQKDYDSALLWMRKMLRYEVKPITLESIMNNYKSLDVSSRIGLLEYIRTLFSNTKNPSHRYMYLRSLGALAGQYRMLLRHDDALQLQYEILNTLQNPSNEVDEKRNLLQATLSTLMFASNYDFKTKNYMRDCLYYEQMITPVQHTSKIFSKQRNAKLKIGFLSADFCNHPVTYVLNGFVEHVDKSAAELYLLHMAPSNGSFVAKSYLCKHVDHIVELPPTNKAAHITTIENLDLDILVDMCGHTSNNSPEAMDILRAKPARVICNYFAYPGTTGIHAVDFKIGDTVALPESSRALFTEDFQHIDNGFHSYKPLYDIDIVKTVNETVQFGVFNNPQKFTTTWLDAVATILQRTADSRIHFCYAGFSDKSLQFYYHTELENRGISNTRVLFHEANEFAEYASLFKNIDIALDTFPYNGGTVSIESIYFKTPYVSLLGEDYVARVGASILHQVAHPELVATSVEDYIEKAVTLAADRDRTRNYHATLRNDLLRSTLGNGKAFAAHFMKAMAEMLEKKGFTHAPVPVPVAVRAQNPWDFFKRRYVINLKDSADRRAAITDELDKVHMEFELFDAVDGRKDFDFLRNYYLKKGLITEKFAEKMNPAELGCLLSHFKIYEKEYQQMKDEQYWILIMEDDVTFSPKLTPQLLQSYIDHWPVNARHVRLGFSNYFKDNKKDVNPYFVEFQKMVWWNGCYAVHTSLLKSLLTKQYNDTVDIVFFPPMYGCKTIQEESTEFYKANTFLFEGLCAERKQTKSTIRIHNAPIQVAKIQHYTKEDPLAITVGHSEENSMTILLDTKYPPGTYFRMNPTQYSDEFETIILGDTLRVTRTDAPGGWAYRHSGRIVLPPIHIDIGISQTSTKTIPLEYQPNDQFILLKNPYKDTFDFTLENNTLVVKRTDSDSGWAYSHKGMLYKVIPTEIHVPTTGGAKIPKLLIQTYKDNVLHPALYNNTMDFLNRNKDFSYKLITDALGLQLIKDHFDVDTVWAFQRLNVGAAKGDFLRYVALYVYGGVYLDLDSSIHTVLSTYIQPDDEFIFFYDDANLEQNCFMIRPKHELLKAIIEEMVRRIYTKEDNIFITTGPVLVTDVIYNAMKGTRVYNAVETVPQQEKMACWKSGPFMGGRFVYRPANDPDFQFKVEGYDESMLYNNHDNYHTNNAIVHSRLYKPNSFPKFHISLTTIPSRFKSIYRTVDTLLKQTYKPESIIVNIPKTYGFRFNGISIPEEDIAQFVRRYESTNKVRINRVDEDYGPGTKLLGVLDVKDIEDDSYIILVDDDVIYDDVLHEYLPCLDKYNTASMNIQTYNEGFDNGPVYSGEGVTTYLMKKSILNRFRGYYNVIRGEKILAFHDDLYIAYYFHLLHEKIANVNKRNKYPCMYYRNDEGKVNVDALVDLTGDLSRETISKNSIEILNRFTNEGRFSFLQKKNVTQSKIGIFLRPQNFYSNGAGMNAVFLRQSLEALGYEVDCITNVDTTKSPVICDRLPYTYKDMNSCDYKEYSAILFGTLVPPESERKKIKDAGVKIFMFHPCNSYDGFHNEHFLYPSKSTTMPLFEATFQNFADTVLITDNHQDTTNAYVRTLNQNKVAIQPLRLTWHPLFLYKNNTIPQYIPRKADQKLDIVIMEPNLGYCKCGWMPLVIAERFYKLNPSVLNAVYYFMQPAEDTEAQAMIQSLQLWKDSKVKLYPRAPINDILNHFGDGESNDNHRVVFLSHNINCELNYAYFDILYTGFPLVHNSLALHEKAQGYYYDTVEDGANAIGKALTHNPIQARNDAKGFFEHMDPLNASFLKELTCILRGDIPPL